VTLDPVRDGFAAGFRLDPRLDLVEWADQHYRLSPESAANPGPWTTLPYQRGILQASGDPSTEFLTVQKSARVGYTKLVNILVGYSIAEEPCPVMVVQPTIPDAEGYSLLELAPMIRDVEPLRGKIADSKSRDSGNTMTRKNFPGGVLVLVGANSPAGFRRLSIKRLLFDEIDGYPPATSEGDQLKLGLRRTEYYWDRLVVYGSTPTITGSSRIAAKFEESDQRRYFVPCPYCGAFQYLKWSGIVWPEGDPWGAGYACEECGQIIPHNRKREMVEAGEWRATNPDGRPGHVGFHIWAAYSYSPNATWGHLAAEFLEAKGDRETLRTFVNTVLGETFDPDDGDGADEDSVAARGEPYDARKLPGDVLVLTAGVDVQRNPPRHELEIWGVGLGWENWSADYIVLPGVPEQPDVWEDLARVLARDFETADGRVLNVAATCIDSGYLPEAVYDFVRRRQVRRVFATKGQSQAGKPIVGPPTKAGPQKDISLVPIGTDTAKDLLAGWLNVEEPGPGYCHFPAAYDAGYFLQLTAEHAVTLPHRGVPRRVWRLKRGRRRNEALDCRILAMAAAKLLRPNLPVLAEKATAEAEAIAAGEPRPAKRKAKRKAKRRRRWVQPF